MACYGPQYVAHEDVVDFFQTAVAYFRGVPTHAWLAAAGILPSNSTTYTLADVQGALAEGFGAVPYLACSGARYNETGAGAGSADGGYTVLSEVWYCELFFLFFFLPLSLKVFFSFGGGGGWVVCVCV